MKLFGQELSAAELRERVGRLDQVAGVRAVVLDSGFARGARAALVTTGSGLDFTVLVDRCLDIGAVTYNGVPIGWRSSTGDVAPQFFEPEHLRFLRSFQGGLLATCGLTNVGSPQEGSELHGLGLHGRIGATPAEDVSIWQGWEGERYALRVSGTMREASVFGEKFALRRSITAWLGEAKIQVHDELTNEAFQPMPFQLLYHVNVGWPVVDEGTRIIAPTRRMAPRDGTAEAGIERWHTLDSPTPGYSEQVFYHDMEPGADGMVEVSMAPSRKDAVPGVTLRYSAATLPRFTQWKMMGQQEYVVGLEPSNCGVEGRAVDEAQGLLQRLEPGATASFALEFAVGHLPSGKAREAEVISKAGLVKALQARLKG